MIAALLPAVPLLKALHIAALSLWCGALLALPYMLARHDPAVTPDQYRLLRRASHLTYTMGATPAAVVAVIAGTWLVFLREAYAPWLYAKLAFVGLLVVAHAWTGHILVRTAEEAGTHRSPSPVLPTLAILLPVVGILVLVLGKPALDGIAFPDWLLEPRGGQLPFAVPSR